MGVAPESPVQVCIDDDVALLNEQIERLQELGERDDAEDIYDDEDVYDLSVRWGTALAGRLPRMAHYSAVGALTDDDERRFQTLCDKLREVGPLIERFKLARPDLADCPDNRTGGRHRVKRHTPKRRRFLRP